MVWFTTHEVGQDRSELAWRVRESMEFARYRPGNLHPDIMKMPGYSGREYRVFINRLLKWPQRRDPVRYLEVGAWQGSTLCSALYENHVAATVIDNWSEFGGPKEQFHANLARWKGEADVRVLEQDFRTVDFASLGEHEVYLFDGPHEAQDQYDGIALALPALTDEFVLIVDDWNWRRVRHGTDLARRKLGLKIDYAVEVRTTNDDTHPPVWGPDSDWHNGCFIAVCRKP